MLDSETKRRIDTARDILVGKVPDPKSQVEQITIALIYKFMDDMDAEAEELGGERKFFNGDFSKYGWAKLMSPAMGGHEVLNLYAEAITKMPENEGIPALFRDIFKNAYLPYRDPETLKSFLKIINDFEYDHSERLGDAFEYLLSVLSAQGDAGMFRTPRHIIDFMVAVIDPKKDESILDPACGTAGFLISAWKHILQANSKNGRKGAGLTPDERKRLTSNIKGYDISPDMVRLSLVNLYLHGFTDPHISEYDTLTSEDNWNEHSDIILANPPFMSPKGRIKPHKRFSVQAKRSEVLFVDYIAEHLTPNGRAAVIVPEGIIFQSQNAYKQLREMLVKNYLYAVVSLPAGVFQPYSGVKTSILLMDKAVAKQCDSLLFAKVENDGFDLGAQRRKIDKNNLPETLSALQDFHQSCLTGDAFNADCYSNVLKVEKEKIAENGEWNLSADRYREDIKLNITHYEMVELQEVAKIINGRAYKREELLDEGPTLVLRVGNFFSNKSWYYSDLTLPEDKYCNKGDLLYAWSASFGPRIWEGPKAIYHYHIWKIETSDKISKTFLFYLLDFDTENIKADGGRGVAMIHITKSGMEQRKIPLPPLKIQQEIVAEIEGYQKIIDGARAVVENYKPQIQINPDWKVVRLGDVATVSSSKRIYKDDYVSNGIPFYRTKEVVELSQGNDISLELFISNEKYQDIKSKFSVPQKGELLVSAVGTIGISWVVSDERTFYFKDGNLLWVKDFKVIEANYLKYILDDIFMNHMDKYIFGAAYKALTIVTLKQFDIPLPVLETQKKIVAQIEKEQSLVNANKELIILFEQKIKDKIASVWGEK
ncbi:Type I restriction-modification system, DNA-methyltransferase subunit M [Bathymodiolus heckerae thiotrophic gill symbiont]|uniref:N-6 DNA methylase n=1 Tax=Bathymodiolus heckerae thiotrophic gill symbiont TaxID=1052212 RepID=UPI0010AFAC2F|nr:N-6 DNA methylase [Bathymodiolus heckerae thiotrophic gill symbiont]SHN92456.1 Type I restriction-modification system, DNA-methyltransferase subunit M [Bathymodiolus heckerae thiotrophic gill symbiont]